MVCVLETKNRKGFQFFFSGAILKTGIKKTACAVIFRIFDFFYFFAFSVFCSALRGETRMPPAVRDGVHEALLVVGAAAALLNVVDAAQ